MFFSRKPKSPQTTRLLQKHEYLDLLQDGTEDYSASDAVKRAALELAHDRRESLELESWPDPDPTRIFARRCRSQDRLLVHVPFGTDDCFFIAVFSNGVSHPQEYILFDIGAEYQQPILECPAFGPREPATEANVREWVPLLPGKESPFAVIELLGGTYMQVYADTDGFHLEHQLVTTGAHYRRVEVVDAGEAVDTLVSYAFGKYEWAYKKWEQFDL